MRCALCRSAALPLRRSTVRRGTGARVCSCSSLFPLPLPLLSCPSCLRPSGAPPLCDSTVRCLLFPPPALPPCGFPARSTAARAACACSSVFLRGYLHRTSAFLRVRPPLRCCLWGPYTQPTDPFTRFSACVSARVCACRDTPARPLAPHCSPCGVVCAQPCGTPSSHPLSVPPLSLRPNAAGGTQRAAVLRAVLFSADASPPPSPQRAGCVLRLFLRGCSGRADPRCLYVRLRVSAPVSVEQLCVLGAPCRATVFRVLRVCCLW